MKHPVFFSFFCISSPIMIILRIVEQVFLTDQTTGFLLPQFESLGNIITYATYIYIVLLFVWAMFLKQDSAILLQHNMVLCVTSVICALMLLVCAIIETFDVSVALGAFGVISAITLALYAFSVGVYGPFAKAMSIFLSVYAAIALCVEYAKYRKVVAFNNAKFEILTGAAILLFTLCFTRIINNYDAKHYKKLFYFSAAACFLLCAAQCLYPVVAKFCSVSLHGNSGFNLRYFVFMLFSFVTLTVMDVKTKYENFNIED
ncbi:MAG: DUF1980 domain-containing protein [Acutalibacteraceae bacterium]|nr:DUF1980 domain-containing protein [Acutalibacteraceae bacterium]